MLEKRLLIFFTMSLLLVFNASAACVVPEDDLLVNHSIVLCPGTYYLNETTWNGIIRVNANDVVIECNNTYFVGSYVPDRVSGGWAIYSYGFNNVTVKNCNLQYYNIGIFLRHGKDLRAYNNTVASSQAAIYFFDSDSSVALDNNLQNSEFGLAFYNSTNAQFYNNFVCYAYDKDVYVLVSDYTHNDNTCDIFVEDTTSRKCKYACPPGGLPDLIVTENLHERYVNETDNVFFEVSVENPAKWNDPLLSNVNVSLYINNSIVDSTVINMYGVIFNIAILSWVAEAGIHNVSAVADPNNQIPEIFDTNNIFPYPPFHDFINVSELDSDSDGIRDPFDNCPFDWNPGQEDTDSLRTGDVISYWKFDEGSGMVAADSVGGYNGTLLNNPVWTWGKINASIEFDGLDDQVNTTLDLDQSGSTNISMMAWAYPTNDSGWRHQVISSDDGGHDWSILQEGSNWSVFYGSESANTGFSVDLNTWQHLAAVFVTGVNPVTGQQVRFYKDGQEFVINNISYDTSDNNIMIGNNPGPWDEYFQGRIDEVAIYDVALTQWEVQALMDNTNVGRDYMSSDGFGDVCDICPNILNAAQRDNDNDDVGNECDNCPAISNHSCAYYGGISYPCSRCDVTEHGYDAYNLTRIDYCFACCAYQSANPTQDDGDGDGVGDVCDYCESTPPGEEVNLLGCLDCWDSDGGLDYFQAGWVIKQAPNPYTALTDSCTGNVLTEYYCLNDSIYSINVNCQTLYGVICGDDEYFIGRCCNDTDNDNVCQDVDNCPDDYNPSQTDSDWDDIGDVCDICPYDPTNDAWDQDGVCQDVDNCDLVYNPGQENYDSDDYGNACDNCWYVNNNNQADSDVDCIYLWPDPAYWDGSAWLQDPHCGNACDNCPFVDNINQEDWDNDGEGDHCDCNDAFKGPPELGADCGPACGNTCPLCVPLIYSGDTAAKFDIVFVPDADYGGNMEKFVNDSMWLVLNSYLGADEFYANRCKFNFWYYPLWGSYQEVCELWMLPATYYIHCGFADSAAIIFTTAKRACSTNGVFSAPSGSVKVAVHETGHQFFDLSDEYCCDGSYWMNAILPSVFPSLNQCKQYSSAPSLCEWACPTFKCWPQSAQDINDCKAYYASQGWANDWECSCHEFAQATGVNPAFCVAVDGSQCPPFWQRYWFYKGVTNLMALNIGSPNWCNYRGQGWQPCCGGGWWKSDWDSCYMKSGADFEPDCSARVNYILGNLPACSNPGTSVSSASVSSASDFSAFASPAVSTPDAVLLPDPGYEKIIVLNYNYKNGSLTLLNSTVINNFAPNLLNDEGPFKYKLLSSNGSLLKSFSDREINVFRLSDHKDGEIGVIEKDDFNFTKVVPFLTHLASVSTEDGNGSIIGMADLAPAILDYCESVGYDDPECGVSDLDADGVDDVVDNCPTVVNPDQADQDLDGVGNTCDNCLGIYNPNQTNSDDDVWGDLCDNCPYDWNPGQEDADRDSIGDACELMQFNMTLNQGWNLISFPLKPVEYDYVFSTLWGYPWYNISNLTDVQPEDGYWTKAPADSVAIINGTLLNNIIYKSKLGWNLISWPKLIPESVSIYPSFSYENHTWYSSKTGKPINTLFEMKPGLGYWVEFDRVTTFRFINGSFVLCINESCDGVDNDCDGLVDEPGAQNCTWYYLDSDNDGYGSSSMCLCSPAGSFNTNISGDCDDRNPNVNPGENEVCTDDLDNDCDGFIDCDDSDCGSVPCPPGYCEAFRTISCGETHDWSTTWDGSQNRIDVYPCDNTSAPAREVTYHFTPPFAGPVNVTATLNPGVNKSIFVLTEPFTAPICYAGNCIVQSNPASFTADPSRNYFFVVDGNQSGRYMINVTCT